ncbi:MAG: C25 family cysteine peptidase, partial [Bacteroidota bacterium]
MLTPAVRPLGWRLPALAAGLLCLVASPLVQTSAAQQATVELIEETANGRTYAVTFTWSMTLSAAADSAYAQTLDRSAAFILTDGLFDATELILLPPRVTPQVRIVERTYDELALPLDQAAGHLAPALMRPVAEVSPMGLFRKQPAVDLTVRSLTYDPATQQVQRTRRVVVQVSYVRSGSAGASLGSTARALSSPQVTESALATGRLFKLTVTEDGIYRIDRELLEQLGLNPDQVDPNAIQVLGNGGAPLPAWNNDPRPIDLIENPAFARGGGDGAFQEGDVVLFHGRSLTGWTYNSEAGWTHYVHPFATENAYFLKVGTTAARRLDLPPFRDRAATPLSQVTGRFVKDYEEFMWGPEGQGEGTGLNWVSNTFRSGPAFPVLDEEALPGLAGGTVDVELRAAIAANPRAFLNIEANGTEVASLTASLVGSSVTSPSANPTTGRFSLNLAANQPLSLSAQLQNQVNAPEAAINWVRVFYPQRLEAQDNRLRFVTPAGQTGTLAATLTGFSQEPQVWDVTRPGEVQRLPVQPQGTGYRVLMDVASADEPREIIAFVEGSAQLLTPTVPQASETPNQNLRGQTQAPEFVIITPEIFADQAERLADHRRAEGLDVAVVGIDQVINEFSGGVPDMRAVRDYFKFLYDLTPGPEPRLRYALLFGDGHYDYRGIRLPPEQALTNWIFPHQTDDTFDPGRSYTSDDYFGLLDDDEGRWRYAGYNSPGPQIERVDIGIGRLPVQTLEEATLFVDKIIAYEDPATFGAWRTRYAALADDGRSSTEQLVDFDLHVQNIDSVVELVKAVEPAVNATKVYGPSFPRPFRNGFRIPGARRSIVNAMNDGVLVFGYSGHGGPEALADEEILTAEDARSLTNG